MDALLKSISNNVWVRAGILAAVVLVSLGVVMLMILPTSKLLFFSAYFAPGLLVGAAAGWLAYSRKVWLVTTAAMVVLTAIAYTTQLSWQTQRAEAFSQPRLSWSEREAIGRKSMEGWFDTKPNRSN